MNDAMTGAGYLEQEMERQTKRLTPAIYDEPIIRSENDIKRLIAELNRQSHERDMPMSVEINDNNETFKVTAAIPNRTRREILMEGMLVVEHKLEVKKQMENSQAGIMVNGRLMVAKTAGDNSKVTSWVDKLLPRWLGAYRDNNLICWRINNSVYKYDIINNRLFKD